MDRQDLVRLRWRLRGAWLWPSFVVLTIVDAAIVHWLPPQGDSENPAGAWLISAGLMFLAILLGGPLLGLVLRWVRRDLPWSVARNYAGTVAVLAVSAGLLSAGLVHRSTVRTDRSAMLDASQRAEAWIGDHAPARFQQDVQEMSTIAIQAPQIYRSCVSDPSETRFWCVVVDRSQPFGAGVRFGGTESNQLLSQGVN